MGCSGNPTPGRRDISDMTNETEDSGNRKKNEKKNWFHSLSRRKKVPTSTTSNGTSQKQQSNECSDSTGVPASAAATSTIASSQESSAEDSANSTKERKRRNFFQRFKKHVGIRFSMRQKKVNTEATVVSDSSDQCAEKAVGMPKDSSANVNTVEMVCCAKLDPPEMVPFTHHYRKFVTKKWLENGIGPNRVMYFACSEMLGQVWYWGEISRRDAQRQLTDKPIGSFLVRDSETGGPSTRWYTLSFRLHNCTLHYRLVHRVNYWHFEEFQYESIVEMIEDILHRCTKKNYVCYVNVQNEMQPPLPVVLKHPLSRYIKIMTLQDLCRRVIQRYVPADRINGLEIPIQLQEYLNESSELVFQSL